MIDQELLNILACPLCKGDVFLKDDKITCKSCEKNILLKTGCRL